MPDQKNIAAGDDSISAWSIAWAAHRGLALFFLESCSSTNDLAKESAFGEDDDRDFRLYLSAHQTAGRGRAGRQWLDDSRSTLLSSWSFKANGTAKPLLTARLGLALVKAASASFPFLPWSLKSPNDLFLNDRKIAGLLVESVAMGKQGRLIVGLGFNAGSAPEGVEIATGLRTELGAFQIEKRHWWDFLDRWHSEMQRSLSRADRELDAIEAESIRDFLNRRPSLEEKILRVEADGSLVTAKGTTNWMEI